MSKLIAAAVFLIVICGAVSADARVRADDCPPGSTDPDCVDATKAPPGK